MGKRAIQVVRILVSWLAIGNATADNVNCLNCHDGIDPVARDLVDYYVTPHANHPINVAYPQTNPDYFPLSGGDGNIWYFDSNRNGQLDENDIQLFGSGITLTCATCHLEHDTAPLPGMPRDYVRGGNVGSQQCITCHRI